MTTVAVGLAYRVPSFQLSLFQLGTVSLARGKLCLSRVSCLSAIRFFSQANDWIATKLAHDGPQVSLHPGCARGQGQGQGQLSAVYCHFGWLVSRVARHHFVRVGSVPSRKLGPARTRPRVFVFRSSVGCAFAVAAPCSWNNLPTASLLSSVLGGNGSSTITVDRSFSST